MKQEALNPEITINKLPDFFNKITFKQVFLWWIGIVLLFSIIYYGFSFFGKFLDDKNSPEGGFLSDLYFSFETAAAIGFGDVVPLGFARVIAIIEALTGLALFGILVSKLVSIKQTAILEEVYELSFDEKIHKLREALRSYRGDVDSVVNKVEITFVQRKNTADVMQVFSSFELMMEDIKSLICDQRAFTKKIDEIRLELLLRSIRKSLFKSLELVKKLDEKHFEWKNSQNIENIRKILSKVKSIQDYYSKKFKSQKINKEFDEMNTITFNLGQKML